MTWSGRVALVTGGASGIGRALAAAIIEDGLDLATDLPGVDFHNFRPDRTAAAGGALPKVAGTTR